QFILKPRRLDCSDLDRTAQQIRPGPRVVRELTGELMELIDEELDVNLQLWFRVQPRRPRWLRPNKPNLRLEVHPLECEAFTEAHERLVLGRDKHFAARELPKRKEPE